MASPIKQGVMKTTLQKDEKTATTLTKSLQGLLKNEKNINESNSQLAAGLNTIADNETTPNIKKIFQDTSQSVKQIVASHQRYVSSLESKIIPSTVSYNNDIKTLKTQLADFEKKFLAEHKVEITINSQKNPMDAAKSQQLQKKHEEAKRDTEKSQQALMNKMREYAYERNLELKALLQHFIHSQMVYHASAMEHLTTLSQKVQQFDEEAESKNLIEQLLDEKGINKGEMELIKN